MSSFSCEAILFDLDGVLVDSTPCASRIWATWARECGLDPDTLVHGAHGQRTIETVRKVAPFLDAQHEADKIEEREVNDTDGLTVVPGAQELLAALPTNRYTIVTSGTRRLATARLRAAGLQVPPRIITADDVTHGKPDPEPYLAGARLLGREPKQCVVFEDAPAGIRAAKAAGTVVIALTTTYDRDELLAADLIIDSLERVGVQIGADGRLTITVADVRELQRV